MQASERILAWIELFEKSREINRHARVPTTPPSGSEIFKQIFQNDLEIDLDSAAISAMNNSHFANFNYSEAKKIISSPTTLMKKEEDRIINIAAVFHECSDLLKIPRSDRDKSDKYDKIDSIIAIYTTQKMNYIFFKKNISDISKGSLAQIQTEYINDTSKRIDRILTQINDRIEEKCSSYISSFSKNLDDLRESSQISLKDEIEKHRLEIGASLIVKDAEELWNEKHLSHKTNFYYSIVLFIFSVIISIIIPIQNWESIKIEVLKLEPLFQGHILGAITIILIPVLGIAWILRLLSRFTIQNMILADDAQMRRVMAQTYVKLVSAKAIEDPQDRAIILTALFRPLPGTQSEDISPPSISDILKTGSK